MYKDLYTEEEVIKILTGIKESINREIDAAINSNYAAIDVRATEGVNVYEDSFCQHCYGKIWALDGIQSYINHTINELTGVRDEENT